MPVCVAGMDIACATIDMCECHCANSVTTRAIPFKAPCVTVWGFFYARDTLDRNRAQTRPWPRMTQTTGTWCVPAVCRNQIHEPYTWIHFSQPDFNWCPSLSLIPSTVQFWPCAWYGHFLL